LFTWASLALAVVLGTGSVAGAGVVSLGAAAEAGTTAERVIVTGPGLLFPIEPLPRCEVLNNFGGTSKTFGSGGHQGVDIGAGYRQKVFAVEDGVLYRKFTDLSSPAGLGWGLLGNSDTKYRYYHLDGFGEGLEVGDAVRAGDLIGYVGDTGNASPGGYHLHFEVRPGPDPHTTPVDPVPLLAIPTICKVYPKAA
jgi:murein DD-endopeptidase MepM/ murein hydrolase activator NlpD